MTALVDPASVAHLCSRETFERIAGPGGVGLKPPTVHTPVVLEHAAEDEDELDAVMLEMRREMWRGKPVPYPWGTP